MSSSTRGGNTGCWGFLFAFVFILSFCFVLFYQKHMFVPYEVQVRGWTLKDFNICPCRIKVLASQ